MAPKTESPSYDVIIIGGGVTGAGTARDCAMRGLRTLLLEKGAPGAATTASSTHLIHGGLRYLLYDRLTTHTTCWDSGHITRIAGPLLTRLPLLWPVYRDHTHGLETVETLLEVYDGFQRMKGGRPHLRLSASETTNLVPNLEGQGLLGSISFDEWWVDPVELVKKNLDSARRHGAEIRSEENVTALLCSQGTITGVISNGKEINARLVINAAGPWVDKISSLAGINVPLRLQKGTHLIYKKRLVPVGLLLEAADRGRYIFLVPSKQGTLIGPTDLPFPGQPDQVFTTPDEISYLLASVKRYFPDFPEKYDATVVGARPILGQSGSEKLLSREYEVFDHLNRDGLERLITIGGGKMSDFRQMASAAADLACAKLGLKIPCRTHCETLEGAPIVKIPFFPQPWRPLKKFLRRHPRLRELHALVYLGFAFIRHALWRVWRRRPASAEYFKDYYK